jgi:16S rRNA C967 or C1407 C5-methylase (RsmB/RsmF family)
VLVYSTCTISPTENERQIAAFLDRHPDFRIDDLASELPGFAMGSPGRSGDPAAMAPAKDDRPLPAAPGFVLTLPHRDHTAGFFVARLRRS